jgi:hypothetical protein
LGLQGFLESGHITPVMQPNLFRGTQPWKGTLPVLVAALLFYFFLWLLDFPKPMIDDLFYSGAGFNMAGGGDFSNPFVSRYFPGQHFFFVYPPVYSYLLAGWLKIFGVSAAAATGFQVLMYFITTVAVIAILRRNEVPVWLAWLAPLIAAGTLMDQGMRTEATAAALTWGGFAIIECGARKAPGVFFAFLLMFLAGVTAPRIVIFDVGLMLIACWRLWEDSSGGARQKWRFVIPAVAAFAMAILIFLAMIHFRVGEFLAVFDEHSKIIKFKKGAPISLRHLTFLTACAFAAIFAWRFRRDHLVQLCVALGAALCGAILTATLGYGMGGWHALLLVLFFGAALARRASGYGRLAVQSALTIFLLLRNLSLIIQVFGILSGHISPDRGGQYQSARALTSTPEHPLLLDPFVARYTFDYRTPPGSIDFAFSAPFPSVGTVMPSLMAAKLPDTYLLGPRFRNYVERSTYLPPEERPCWTPLRQSFDAYPRKVYIVRAEECKGLKSATERP